MIALLVSFTLLILQNTACTYHGVACASVGKTLAVEEVQRIPMCVAAGYGLVAWALPDYSTHVCSTRAFACGGNQMMASWMSTVLPV
jgi:hypothetical protein